MPDSYSFCRPLFAPNRAGAAFERKTSSTQSAQPGDYARGFCESGAASLAEKTPLVLSAAPAWLKEDEFIQKFDANQALFVVPATNANAPKPLQHAMSQTTAPCRRRRPFPGPAGSTLSKP